MLHSRSTQQAGTKCTDSNINPKLGERQRDVLCIQTDRNAEVSFEDRGTHSKGRKKEENEREYGMRNGGCEDRDRQHCSSVNSSSLTQLSLTHTHTHQNRYSVQRECHINAKPQTHTAKSRHAHSAHPLPAFHTSVQHLSPNHRDVAPCPSTQSPEPFRLICTEPFATFCAPHLASTD